MNQAQQASITWNTRRIIGAIVVGLLMGEIALVVVVGITRDLILPAFARLMGGEQNSPLSLGTQDYGWADMFSIVLQLCLAAIVSILVYAWSQRTPRAPRGRSLGLSGAALPLVTAVPTAPPVTPRPTGVEPIAPAGSAIATVASTRTVSPGASSPGIAAASGAAVPVSTPAATTPRPAVERAPEPSDARPQQAIQPQPAVTKPVNTVPLAPAGAATSKAASSNLAPQVSPARSSDAPPKVQAPPVAGKVVKPKKQKEIYYNIVGERISPPDDEE